MKRSIFTMVFSAAVVLSVLSLGGCGEKVKPGETEVGRQKVTSVKTEIIRKTRVDDYYETSGTVRAKTASIVASRVMGTVTSVRVKEGDKVRQGQLLLTTDDTDVVHRVKGAQEGYREAEQALEAARENSRLAGVTYQRYRKLFEEKALSGQELDRFETEKKIAEITLERAKAAVNRAEAGVKEALAYQEFGRVTAPVGGTVTEKKIEAGSMAVPGAPLFVIEDTSSFRVEADIDERLSGKIEPGASARVFIEALNREIWGTIDEVVPSVDPSSRSFLVKIGIKGEGLTTGLYGKISIPVGKKEVLLVPRQAIVEKGQLTGVYTVDENAILRYTLVRTGGNYDGKVEVISGLEPGEVVVVDGTDNAIDGAIAVQE